MEVQFAQKALILSDRGILFVLKSVDDPLQPLKWELPGGRLKKGESLTEHLRREILEEVGLSVNVGRPLSMWKWRLGDATDAPTVVAVVRLCRLASGDAVSLEGNQSDDFLETWKWVRPEEVEALALIPNAREGTLQAVAEALGKDFVA
jgi:8-oxo-dGTP diphosphatase